MDIVALLYEQAREIAKEGHAGWGNTMVLAAEEIEKLRASQQSAHTDEGEVEAQEARPNQLDTGEGWGHFGNRPRG